MEKQRLLRGFIVVLILPSTAAIQTLKNMKDLKNSTTSMKEFPRHGLMLLHWFANTVDVEPSGEMRLCFDPGQGSYGSHGYEDTAGKAPFDSTDSLYYALGDLDRARARMLPFYVTHDFHHSTGTSQQNVDRLLIRVQKSNHRKVEKVFVTELYNDNRRERRFNLAETHEISVGLLSQIQALGTDIACNANDARLDCNLCEFLHHQQKASKVLMLYPQSPGLEWFLSLSGYNIDSRHDAFLRTSICAINRTANSSANCSPRSNGISDIVHNKIKLEVKSIPKGYAKLTWSGIPEHVARMNLKLGLCRGRSDPKPLTEYPLDGRTYGSINTGVPLNPGLYVQLLQSEKIRYYIFFGTTHYTTIRKGPEFDEANGIPPVTIRGYQCSLQLYVKDGFACARLYIRKSFQSWKNVFDNAWVGIYARETDNNAEYDKFEWSINFKKSADDECCLDYEIYQYESSMSIGPGVQARFMLTRNYSSEKARTVPWVE